MIIFKTELIRRVWEKVNVDSEGYKDRIKQVDVETIINTFLQEMSQCMICLLYTSPSPRDPG